MDVARKALGAERVRIGGISIWVRGSAVGGLWDRAVVRPILEDDEYRLGPIVESGAQPRWIVDIGSHVGAFTLLAKKVWPQARVVAADPDPESAELFRRNTAELDCVDFHEVAVLGDDRGARVHLREGRFNDDRNAAASRVAEVVRPLDPNARPPTRQVDAVGIVDLLRRYDMPTVDVLKLDCEGAEGEILVALSAAGLLDRVRWIRGEWHFRENRRWIEEALRPTHDMEIEEAHWRNGPFRGSLRDTSAAARGR